MSEEDRPKANGSEQKCIMCPSCDKYKDCRGRRELRMILERIEKEALPCTERLSDRPNDICLKPTHFHLLNVEISYSLIFNTETNKLELVEGSNSWHIEMPHLCSEHLNEMLKRIKEKDKELNIPLSSEVLTRVLKHAHAQGSSEDKKP